MQDLKAKTIRGILWNSAERLAIRVVQILPAIFLARLLTPAEFGLVGMLAIFTALAQVFLDSGFGAALIQKKEITYADECTIFYFNLGVGILAVAVFYVSAPWVAAFYNQPLLLPLMRILSLDILLKSFSLIQTTLLTRALDFKTQTIANVVASLASGVAGIGAAYLGWGIWSLVIQTMSGSLLRLIILWALSRWRPALLFSLASLKSMARYGANLLSSSLLSTLFENLYTVMIGKFFSPALVGFYTRSNLLKTTVLESTAFAFGKVFFASMSTIQDDAARLLNAYRIALRLTTFIHFPIMAGVIVLARPLIVVLFSEQWLESVILLQLLCVGVLVYPLQNINLNVLRAKGRTDLYLRIVFIQRMFMTASIFALYPWGLNAMLIGQIFISCLAYFLNIYYSNRVLSYSLRFQVQDVLPNLIFSVLMALAMWAVGASLPPMPWLLLLVQTLSGALVYLALNALTKSAALREAFSIGKSLLVNLHSG